MIFSFISVRESNRRAATTRLQVQDKNDQPNATSQHVSVLGFSHIAEVCFGTY